MASLSPGESLNSKLIQKNNELLVKIHQKLKKSQQKFKEFLGKRNLSQVCNWRKQKLIVQVEECSGNRVYSSKKAKLSLDLEIHDIETQSTNQIQQKLEDFAGNRKSFKRKVCTDINLLDYRRSYDIGDETPSFKKTKLAQFMKMGQRSNFWLLGKIQLFPFFQFMGFLPIYRNYLTINAPLQNGYPTESEFAELDNRKLQQRICMRGVLNIKKSKLVIYIGCMSFLSYCHVTTSLFFIFNNFDPSQIVKKTERSNLTLFSGIRLISLGGKIILLSPTISKLGYQIRAFGPNYGVTYVFYSSFQILGYQIRAFEPKIFLERDLATDPPSSVLRLQIWWFWLTFCALVQLHVSLLRNWKKSKSFLVSTTVKSFLSMRSTLMAPHKMSSSSPSGDNWDKDFFYSPPTGDSGYWEEFPNIPSESSPWTRMVAQRSHFLFAIADAETTVSWGESNPSFIMYAKRKTLETLTNSQNASVTCSGRIDHHWFLSAKSIEFEASATRNDAFLNPNSEVVILKVNPKLEVWEISLSNLMDNSQDLEICCVAMIEVISFLEFINCLFLLCKFPFSLSQNWWCYGKLQADATRGHKTGIRLLAMVQLVSFLECIGCLPMLDKFMTVTSQAWLWFDDFSSISTEGIIIQKIPLANSLPCKNLLPRLLQQLRKIETFVLLSEKSGISTQVHVSIVGEDKMRISWITRNSAPSKVDYGTSSGTYDSSAQGNSTTYHFMLYRSGQIHEVVIGPLKPNTVYYYRCGAYTSREFTLKTTPRQLPVKFAVAGDLGQTGWTKSTLDHISKTDYDMLLLPGDLSYADSWQKDWDSFGRLVEPLASQRPWMVTQGNHEVEKIPILHKTPFTAYNARWHMPFLESGSESNLYYSFDVAGGGVHVIMLGSYTDFSAGSSQYSWLEGDLKRIDRKRTAWVVAVIHAPWYNSNEAHQGESESVDMKKAMEKLVYDYRVDLVFAGHVHAYERFSRVYDGKVDNCGPVHITIGDGGNREGLSASFMEPAPEISIFREASFGHGALEMINSSHARWEWHRNEDDESLVTDSIWLTTLASNPSCKPN